MGSHGNYSILGHLFCFKPYLIDFGVDMYVFEVKESIFKQFCKNGMTRSG